MKIVIMGCGRVGSQLAARLDQEGHQVSVVDINQKAFDRLPPEFNGRTVLGTAIDEDVLRQAGIEVADAFVAMTEGDNRNIMAAQIAKHVFKVERVVTRIYDPIRQDTFKALGLDAVSPTVIGAQVFYGMLTGEESQES